MSDEDAFGHGADGGQLAARTSTFEFVPIGPDEIPMLADLWEAMRDYYVRIAPELPTYSRDDSWGRRAKEYRELLEDPLGLIVGLAVDGELVAYAATRSTSTSSVFAWSENTAELETLVVAESARGRGFGGRLLGHVRELLRRRGVDELALHVLVGNQAAIDFYRGEGFSPYLLYMSDAIPS